MRNQKKEFCAPVRIEQESNGFIVILGSSCEGQERYVFQTFNELINFLSDNFTYRQSQILID
jgi:hypothetical protein